MLSLSAQCLCHEIFEPRSVGLREAESHSVAAVIGDEQVASSPCSSRQTTHSQQNLPSSGGSKLFLQDHVDNASISSSIGATILPLILPQQAFSRKKIAIALSIDHSQHYSTCASESQDLWQTALVERGLTSSLSFRIVLVDSIGRQGRRNSLSERDVRSSALDHFGWQDGLPLILSTTRKR